MKTLKNYKNIPKTLNLSRMIRSIRTIAKKTPKFFIFQFFLQERTKFLNITRHSPHPFVDKKTVMSKVKKKHSGKS